MRVLHVINSLASGGAEKMLTSLLPELNKELDLTLLVLTKKGNVFHNKLVESNVKVEYLTNLTSLYNPVVYYKLKKYFRSKAFDVVHVHLFPGQYLLPFASKNIKSFVFTEHSTTNRRRNKLLIPIERFIHSKYSNYVFVSKSAKNSFETFLSNESTKNVVIYNGVVKSSVEARINYREKLNINEGKKIITMISNFKKEKNHKLLLDAIKEIPNVYILFAGEGELKDVIQEYSKQLNLSDRVKFLGYVENINELITQSNLIVQSSFYEGFGMAVLESMVLGVPVIVSDIDGLKEVVDSDLYRFQKDDSNKLKTLITKIFNDKNFYSEMIQYVENRSKNFSIFETSKEHIKLYKELQ